MKKHLFVCLGVALVLILTAEAKKTDPRTNLATTEGKAPAVKLNGAKLPSIGTFISATGYADAWRATAGMAGKSIIVYSGGDCIGAAFGTVGSACNLVFGYSLDSGKTWQTQPIAANMNPGICNGLALDASGSPYIVWQVPNAIVWSRDEGGIGGGLWTPPDTVVSDSVTWSFPTIAIGGNNWTIGAIRAIDISIYYTSSHSLGWNKWGYNEIAGQGWDIDAVDWLISGSGDTVIGYLEVIDANGAFIPAYKVSTDSGLTFSSMQFFDLPPQYNGGGWWYRYDGAWIGDRPHLLFTHSDNAWNGNALFEMHPTVAGDFSAWTIQRISDIPGNLAGVTPGDLNGGGVDVPTISSDSAGNIYAIYQDFSKNNDSYEIFGVASTDHGATWLNPVQLTTQAPEFDGNIYLEAAEVAGGDKIHMLFHDPAYTNIYYWNVPTSTILAGTVRPEEITLAPELCGSSEGGWGGPIDAVMDTVEGPGDTLTTYWAPKVASGGNYIIQISQSQDFTCGWFYPDSVNVNYITTIGMPDTNVVWYWRVCSYKDGVNSPLSEVYDFYYKGTTITNPPWTLFGVEGMPIEKVTYKFSLNQNRPNPVNKLAELSFTLPKSGNYSLKIYNIAGQVIRNLDGKGNAGQNTVTWNGLDNSGRKAANGVYLYNLNAFGNSATKKLVVLR